MFGEGINFWVNGFFIFPSFHTLVHIAYMHVIHVTMLFNVFLYFIFLNKKYTIFTLSS